MKTSVSELPVMKACCKTCPFKKGKNGMWQDMDLANKVISRTLFNSQQICHGTEGKNRKANNRCLGAFEYNSEIYKRMGFEKFIK